MPRSPITSSHYLRPPGVPRRRAAGGVVVRGDGRTIYILLTRDKGKSRYILPKGGTEKRESLVAAARREIAEEAGASDLRFVKSLGHRSRLSFDKDRWTTTFYYLFVARSADLAPTADDRYRPKWFDLAALPAMLWPEQEELIRLNRLKIRKILRFQPRGRC